MPYNIAAAVTWILNELVYSGNGISVDEWVSKIDSFTSNPDDPVQRQEIWDSFRQHPDAWVGEDRAGNVLSLEEIQALPPAIVQPTPNEMNPEDTVSTTKDPKVVSVRSRRRRKSDQIGPEPSRLECQPGIRASETLQWNTITGHGVDAACVPLREWQCLVEIAKAREEGILQPDLCKITGQDKRSVPRRCDFLALKGYIVKRRVDITAGRTSLLTLKKFAVEPFDPMDLDLEHIASGPHPMPGFEYWTGRAVDPEMLVRCIMVLLQAFKVIRRGDLRKKMNVEKSKRHMKILERTLRGLCTLGVLKRVSASMGVVRDDGKDFADCFSFVRHLTSDELQLFRKRPSSIAQYYKLERAGGIPAEKAKAHSETVNEASGSDEQENDIDADESEDLTDHEGDTSVFGRTASSRETKSSLANGSSNDIVENQESRQSEKEQVITTHSLERPLTVPEAGSITTETINQSLVPVYPSSPQEVNARTDVEMSMVVPDQAIISPPSISNSQVPAYPPKRRGRPPKMFTARPSQKDTSRENGAVTDQRETDVHILTSAGDPSVAPQGCAIRLEPDKPQKRRGRPPKQAITIESQKDTPRGPNMAIYRAQKDVSSLDDVGGASVASQESITYKEPSESQKRRGRPPKHSATLDAQEHTPKVPDMATREIENDISNSDNVSRASAVPQESADDEEPSRPLKRRGRPPKNRTVFTSHDEMMRQEGKPGVYMDLPDFAKGQVPRTRVTKGGGPLYLCFKSDELKKCLWMYQREDDTPIDRDARCKLEPGCMEVQHSRHAVLRASQEDSPPISAPSGSSHLPALDSFAPDSSTTFYGVLPDQISVVGRKDQNMEDHASPQNPKLRKSRLSASNIASMLNMNAVRPKPSPLSRSLHKSTDLSAPEASPTPADVGSLEAEQRLAAEIEAVEVAAVRKAYEDTIFIEGIRTIEDIKVPGIENLIKVAKDGVFGHLYHSPLDGSVTFSFLRPTSASFVMRLSDLKGNPETSSTVSDVMTIAFFVKSSEDQAESHVFRFASTPEALTAASNLRATVITNLLMLSNREQSLATAEKVQKIKSSDKPFKCPKCGGSWLNAEGIKYHVTKARVACNPSYVAPAYSPLPPKSKTPKSKTRKKAGARSKSVQQLERDDAQSTDLTEIQSNAVSSPTPNPRRQSNVQLTSVSGSVYADSEARDRDGDAVMEDRIDSPSGQIENINNGSGGQDERTSSLQVQQPSAQQEQIDPSGPLVPPDFQSMQVDWGKSRKASPQDAKFHREVILNLMERSGGVFPGKRGIWYAFCRELFIRDPTVKLQRFVICNAAINSLADSGKIQKIEFSFRNARNGVATGGTLVRVVLALRGIDPLSPTVLQTKEKIKEAAPDHFCPPEFALPPTVKQKLDAMEGDFAVLGKHYKKNLMPDPERSEAADSTAQPREGSESFVLDAPFYAQTAVKRSARGRRVVAPVRYQAETVSSSTALELARNSEDDVYQDLEQVSRQSSDYEDMHELISENETRDSQQTPKEPKQIFRRAPRSAAGKARTAASVKKYWDNIKATEKEHGVQIRHRGDFGLVSMRREKEEVDAASRLRCWSPPMEYLPRLDGSWGRDIPLLRNTYARLLQLPPSTQYLQSSLNSGAWSIKPFAHGNTGLRRGRKPMPAIPSEQIGKLKKRKYTRKNAGEGQELPRKRAKVSISSTGVTPNLLPSQSIDQLGSKATDLESLEPNTELYSTFNHQNQRLVRSSSVDPIWSDANSFTHDTMPYQDLQHLDSDGEPLPPDEIKSSNRPIKRRRRVARAKQIAKLQEVEETAEEPPLPERHGHAQKYKVRFSTILPGDLESIPEVFANDFDNAELDMDHFSNVLRRRTVPKAMPIKDEIRLLVTVVVIRTLTGGVEKTVDWVLVTGLFNHYSLRYVVDSWPAISIKYKAVISKLCRTFQDLYLEAYENEEVASIDYDHLLDYDWQTLIDWLQEKMETDLAESVQQLPPSREQIHEIYHVRDEYVKDERDGFFDLARPVHKRMEVSSSTTHILKPPSAIIALSAPLSQLEVARSWARASQMTSEHEFDAVASKAKLSRLPNNVMVTALQQLISERILIQRNKGRPTPGRSYEISDTFNATLRKAFTDEHFNQAAKMKARLDEAFAKGQEVELEWTIAEGEIMAITNLQAHRRISIRNINPPMEKFGILDGEYQGRLMDKSRLRFEMALKATDQYVYDHEMPILVPLGSGALDPPLVFQKAIPLWVSIHGKLMATVWRKILAAVMSIVALRSGISTEDLARVMHPSLQLWEVRLLLDWCVTTGMVETCRSGQDDGWTAGEWWWLVVGNMGKA